MGYVLPYGNESLELPEAGVSPLRMVDRELSDMRRLIGKAVIGLGLAGAVLSLAACGSEKETSGPKTMDEVKEEAAELDRPEPGEYKQTLEVTRFEVPGMPKEAADQMKQMLAAKQDDVICLTKADAEHGYRDMFKGVGRGKDCTYSRFDVDGGTIAAQMDCKSPQEGTATMTIDGKVSPAGSDVTVAMDVKDGQPPMGNMKMTMHMTTQRLGDCKS